MAAALFSARIGLLAAWVSAVLYVQLRSRVRLNLERTLTDHTIFTAPYNALIYLFEGRGARRGPFFDPESLLPHLEPLRSEWQTIRDEACAAQSAGLIAASSNREDLAFNTFFRRGWTRFHLKWYGDFLPSAREHCPRTVALLEQLPDVHAALFAVLPAGSKLGRHRDPFAGSLRYHLGLSTPNDDACWIEVDGERYSWRDGQSVLFDETFVHRARNDTDRDRIILFCDVERPIRFAPLRWLNKFLAHRVLRITQSRNTAEESIGALSRVASWAFRASKTVQRLKTAAPRIYAVAKVLVLVGVAAWLILG